MSSWVDEHLNVVRHIQETNDRLVEKARSATHVMYDALRRQMRADIDAFNRRSDNPFQFQEQAPIGFKISRDRYPSLALSLTPDPNVGIVVDTWYQESYSLNEERFQDCVIVLAGRGQDELYYALRGVRYIKPADVSRQLLQRFLF